MFLLLALLLFILWVSGHVVFNIANGAWNLILILCVAGVLYELLVARRRL